MFAYIKFVSDIYNEAWFLTLSIVSYSAILKIVRLRFIIISPPENDSFRKDLCFTADVLFIFFRAQDLWDAWADRLEILHDGQH